MKTHNQSQSGLSFSIALIALDAISLFLAASAASVLTVMTEVYVLDTPPYHVFPDVVETRASIYLVLCFFVLGMFWQKGLYSRRMPWWNQVKYIA